jgi:xylulokinase
MILALDLGSTSFKAALVAADFRLCGQSSRRVQHRFAPGGVVELETGEAVAAVREAIRDALAQAGVRPAVLRAVAVASQAQTFTVVLARRQPLRSFISWQDNRAAGTCARLNESNALPGFGRHCSFGSLLPALQVCQLRHLKETEPRWLEPGSRIVPLPTFFVRRWTGIAALDENLAAMSGLYSLATRTWWSPALRLCALRPDQLPEVRPLGSVAGRCRQGAAEFGLPPGLPVVLAGNDQTAGAYAARLDENNGLLLTLGTAQVAYRCAARLPPQHPALVRGPFPQGRFYGMAADPFGGNLVNWAESVLRDCTTDARFFKQAAAAPPGCSGLVFAPGGEGRSGAWRNLGLHHTPADFARSVIECLARRMVRLVQRLPAPPDRAPVLAAGGGCKSPLWVRVLAETLGQPVTVTAAPPVVGAARMAGVALARKAPVSIVRTDP